MPPFDSFYDLIITAFGALLGWFLKVAYDQLKDLKAAHIALSKTVDDCVRKSDLKELVDRVEKHHDNQFRMIFSRLDIQDSKLDAIKDTLAEKADRKELLEQTGGR